MEDDDEFGDLYTDVLRPFASESSSSAPHPHHTSPAPSSSIDLNLNLNLNLNQFQIPSAASHFNDALPRPSDQITPSDRHETAPPAAVLDVPPKLPLGKEGESADGVRVLLDRALLDSKTVAIGDGSDVVAECIDPMDGEVKFDIEDEDGGSSEPVIPGLSGVGGYEGGGANDDWDSDSEDDLQIVLNDDNHMAMEKGGMVDEADEDEDGGLVIVAGGEPSQGLEEQEWGESATLPVDGERKDPVEPGKPVTGGVSVAPKIGYGSHVPGYHPFHSQFKVSVRFFF